MHEVKEYTLSSLGKLKQLLTKKKDRLEQAITRLEETGIGDTMSYSVGELSMYDNHPGDLGDVMFERSKDIALRDNEHILSDHDQSSSCQNRRRFLRAL